MSGIHVTPMPTKIAEVLWNGGPDANGMAPERHISDGDGVPCRHCLQDVPAGEAYLILGYRPFPEAQPYAEVGPIFLHADPCSAYSEGGALPAMYREGSPKIVRGYDRNDRIVYGTGKVVDVPDITAYAEDLLSREDIAYVHVRSSQNNCFAFRINRAG